MSLVKEEIIGREFVSENGYHKSFSDLNLDETLEVFREQNEAEAEWQRLHALKETKRPVNFTSFLRTPGQTDKQILNDKIIFNSK